MVRGLSPMLYLGVCVDTYAGLKDEKKAAEFRDEAHSRFGNKDDEMFKILLDGVDYDYYTMREEYDKAQAIADRLLTYTSDFSKRLPSKYYVNADLCMRLGKQEEATGFMQKAWEIVKDQGAAMVQTYRLAMKRFGLTDSAQPVQNDTPQQ